MLKTRVLTSLFILPIFALILWLGPKALEITALVITAAIIFEFLNISLLPSRRNANYLKDDAVLYSTLLVLPGFALLCIGQSAALVVTLFSLIFFLIRETLLFESMPDEEPAKELLCAFGSAIMYPFLFGMSLISVIQKISNSYFNNTWQVILWFVLLVIASDTGAYFGGKLLGKHKLAPRISPAKTIEGAVSGFIGVLTCSAVYLYFFNFHGDYLLPSVVTVLVAVLAPVGDLVESWVKRIYTVKDMGSILPGHGGVFDRVDSYIFAAPALYFLTISL